MRVPHWMMRGQRRLWIMRDVSIGKGGTKATALLPKAEGFGLMTKKRMS